MITDAENKKDFIVIYRFDEVQKLNLVASLQHTFQKFYEQSFLMPSRVHDFEVLSCKVRMQREEAGFSCVDSL